MVIYVILYSVREFALRYREGVMSMLVSESQKYLVPRGCEVKHMNATSHNTRIQPGGFNPFRHVIYLQYLKGGTRMLTVQEKNGRKPNVKFVQTTPLEDYSV